MIIILVTGKEKKKRIRSACPLQIKIFFVRALDKYIYTHKCWFNTVYIYIYIFILRGGNKLKAVLAMGFFEGKLIYLFFSVEQEDIRDRPERPASLSRGQPWQRDAGEE